MLVSVRRLATAAGSMAAVLLAWGGVAAFGQQVAPAGAAAAGSNANAVGAVAANNEPYLGGVTPPTWVPPQASAGMGNTGFEASALEGSLFGTPGLWNAQFAETLDPWDVSGSVYVQRYSRNPGAMVFTEVPSGFAVGITHWLELSYDTTPLRRILTASPEQLRFGNFNPIAPFARNRLIHGPDSFTLAATIGLLSQERGAKMGIAVQVSEELPYFQTYSQGVNVYGVNTTEPTFTVRLLADKYIGRSELVGNIGFADTTNADPGGKVNINLPKFMPWALGGVFPRVGRLSGIVEFNGDIPEGGTHSNYFGPTSPIDLTAGLRFNMISWMGLNAGYRWALNTPNANDTGFVIGISMGPKPHHPAPPPPPPPPPAPTMACSATSSVVTPGTAVRINSTATPADQTYTYSWTTTGGRLSPSDAQAQLDTTGLAPGMYRVTVHADNGKGGSGDCSTNVEVREAPRNPPTATCSVTPDSVMPGGAVNVSGQAASPDQRPLTYSWRTPSGTLANASSASSSLDTTGVAPGSYNATLTVTDDRGLIATCNSRFTVTAPPPPPQPSLGSTINFKPNSSRVDNAAKAALDDVALRLQQDPNARAVIVGYATSTEATRALSPDATTKLSEERAVNAKAYLVQEKGISPDRIDVRQDILSPEKAEVWIVPQGATYTNPGQTFDESSVKPAGGTGHE